MNILTTKNENWGFWGTAEQNGYDQQLTWNTTNTFLMKEFGLTAEQSRDVLDSGFGRHLADDLSFIKGGPGIVNGPTSAKAINKHLKDRLTENGWRDCFENAIRQTTGKDCKQGKAQTKDELFTRIAQDCLHVETLVMRNSDDLDFHDVSVSGIKKALEAAYEAGRKANKKLGSNS